MPMKFINFDTPSWVLLQIVVGESSVGANSHVVAQTAIGPGKRSVGARSPGFSRPLSKSTP